MARHVHFEPGLSLTGANADLRYAVSPSELSIVAWALLERVRVLQGHRASASMPDSGLPVDAAALGDLAQRLVASRGRSLVVCGVQDEPTQVLLRH